MGERYTNVHRRRRRVNTDEGRRVCCVHESEVFASELARDEMVHRKRAEERELHLEYLRWPVGGICNAVWEQGQVEYPQESDDVRQALTSADETGGGHISAPGGLAPQGSSHLRRCARVGAQRVVGSGRADFLRVARGDRHGKSPTGLHGTANRGGLLRGVNG